MAPRLAIIGRDAAGVVPAGPALWQSGFRPFFIAAAAHGAFIAFSWMFVLEGWVLGATPIAPFSWHGHEMIFGFALAVVAGFLLTASQVWTGRSTLTGPPLVGAVGLWLLARIGTFFGGWLAPVGAAANVAFPLLVAGAIGGPIVRSKSWRNLPFIGLLSLLALASAAVWSEAFGWLRGGASRALWVALDAVLVMIVVVGGRIVPMFTRNATGARVRGRNVLDVAAPVSLGVVMLGHGLTGTTPLTAGAALAAGALNLARMVGWGGGRALRVPFVGVLHAGYALVAIGLVLEGASELVGVSGTHPGRHVMAIGGIAVMSLGMMTRVSLGHTGRPLHPPRGTGALYGLLLFATVARLLASFVPAVAFTAWWVSAVAFSGAFLGFVAMYAQILLAPRVDGRPG